jgi:hypothetical protein
MSDLQQETVKLILKALHSTNLTIESFVIMAISLESPLSMSFLNGGVEIMLDNLLQNSLISIAMSNWVTFQSMKIYKKEMTELTSKENGFHFLTAKMTQTQLQSFDVEDLMKRMMVIAPYLWKLMETLHAGNSRINQQRARTQKKFESKKVRESKGEMGPKRRLPRVISRWQMSHSRLFGSWMMTKMTTGRSLRPMSLNWLGRKTTSQRIYRSRKRLDLRLYHK